MAESYTNYKDQLSKEYQTAFERIEAYVFTCAVDENTREERLNELLDMFLTAQNEGRPVEKIVGKDIEKFSKLFCSSFSFKNRILNVADALKSYFLYIFVLSALQMIYWFLDLFNDWSEHNIMNRYMNIDVRLLIIDSVIMALLMFIIVVIFRKIMFKMKRFSMKFYTAVGSGVMSLGFIVLVAAELIAAYTNTFELIDTPTIIVFAVSGLFLFLCYLPKIIKLAQSKGYKAKNDNNVSMN